MTTELAELFITVFVVDTTRYLMGAGIVTFMLFIVFRRFSDQHRIQKRRASRADVRREIGFSLLTTSVYAFVALFTVYLREQGFTFLYLDWNQYSALYSVLSFPLVLVLHDAYFYWVHRVMHLKALFRYFHLLHHRSRTPTPWAAYAFAPGEAVLMALFMPIATLIMPLHPVIIFAFLSIMILRNAMGHSGIEFHPVWWVDSPLDVFTTTTHHDLHHQRVKGNYGLYFTWWDRWMGTEFADYKERFREAARGEDKIEQSGILTNIR